VIDLVVERLDAWLTLLRRAPCAGGGHPAATPGVADACWASRA
jgi:hypothetical protein